MADSFYDDIPARANNIGTDIDQIEVSLGYLKDVLQQITGGWSDSVLTGFVPGNMGMFQRPWFSWKDADEIYLEPATIHHAGTTDQMVYWSSQLTFKFGSAGSNSASSNLGASEWHYLYLDDSAIVTAATNVITNSEILNSTTAPAWDAAQYGWYPASATGNVQTTDKCIGAFYSNGSSQVMEFFHDGGDLVLYADGQATDIGGLGTGPQDVDTTWLDVTGVLPSFCRKGLFSGQLADAANYIVAYGRVNGQSGTTGHIIAAGYGGSAAGDGPGSQFVMLVDSSQKWEVKLSASSGMTFEVLTDGYYLPKGM